jgi:hypothetical protein
VGPEALAAVHEVDLGGDAGEVERPVARRIAAADHDDAPARELGLRRHDVVDAAALPGREVELGQPARLDRAVAAGEHDRAGRELARRGLHHEVAVLAAQPLRGRPGVQRDVELRERLGPVAVDELARQHARVADDVVDRLLG